LLNEKAENQRIKEWTDSTEPLINKDREDYDDNI